MCFRNRNFIMAYLPRALRWLLMISRLLIGALSLVTVLHAQRAFTPPPGWSVEEQPAKLVLTPDAIQAGQTIQAEVYDPESGTEDLNSWFLSRVASFGPPVGSPCSPRSSNGYLHCIANQRGHDDYFYGIPMKDGQHRLVHFLMGPNSLSGKPHLMALARILKDSQTWRGHSTIARSALAEASTPPAQASGWPAANSATTPVPAANAATDYVPPLEAIYLHVEYLGGVGGMVYPSYEPYVFLKDGTFTDDLDYYPQSESDLPRWRAHKPRRWGTWTRSAATLHLKWNDPKNKPEVWDKWFDARRGDPDMKLSGLYRSLGGGGNSAMGGSVTVAAWSDFSFSPNGIVTRGGGSGGFSGGPGASVATSSQRKAQQARYQIRNYTVQLAYADGHSETRWFYRFPDSDHVIGIGGSTFVLNK